MITYVNSKDAKLFELAAADLGVESLDIDQYLNKLAELKAISPKYVRLPLYEEGHEDEEIFEIDANARAIKVPASFNKNGVGVVSDELAETLWFKINRYFDIKDFGKAAGVVGDELRDGNLHILIQWEAPDGTKGASWAYAIDIDTDPDFVYFGWALTAEHLTAKAGNIKFAVRIMQYDGDAIAYSFATQAATIAVKASLDFDLTADGIAIESVADKIANRLMGGQIAHCPVFAAPEGEDDLYGGNLPPYILNLQGNPAQATLEVVASAPEGEEYDAMAYKWFKRAAGEKEFVQISGEYSPALTVTSSGEYYVVVLGMKEIVDGVEMIYDAESGSAAEGKFKYHTSVASSQSTICEVPAPIALHITEEMAKALVLQNEPALLLVVERQHIGEDVVGEVSLEIAKTASAAKDLDLETAEFEVIDLVAREGSEGVEGVSEAWIYNEVEYETEAAAKAAVEAEQGELAEGEEYDYSGITHREPVEAIPAVEGYTPPISYTVDGESITINMSNAEEGYYKVIVRNSLNGDHEDTASGVICRVVKPATAPIVSAVLLTEGGNVSDASEGSVTRHNRIRADYTLEALSDELEIKWFKVKGDKDPSDDEGDILIEDASGREFEPDDDGSYYFVMINKVEDTQAESSSAVIVFRA